MPHTLHVCGRNLIIVLTSAASPRVDISSTCKVGLKLGVSLPLLTCSPSAWPSRLLYRRGRKSRRDLWITLYNMMWLRCACMLVSLSALFFNLCIYRWGKKHATRIVTHAPVYYLGQPIRQDVWVIYPQLCNTFSFIFAYIVAVHLSGVYWRPCRFVGYVSTHSALSSARSKNLGLWGTVILVAMIYSKLPCHR